MVIFVRGVQRDLKIAEESSKPQQHVDYSLKAGQKISLNLSVSHTSHLMLNNHYTLFLSSEKASR